MLRQQPLLYALGLGDPLLSFFINIALQLSIRHYPAGYQSIDANAIRAQVFGQAASQADHCGFAGGVGLHLALLHSPAYRAEVDDGAVTELAHLLMNRLGGEKRRTQIHRHLIIPAFGVTSSTLMRESSAALLISMLILPNVWRVDSIAACNAVMSRRSHSMNMGRASVSPSILSHSANASFASTSTKQTCAPCWQNASTRLAPIPLPPPVIKAVRPFRLG